MKRCWRAFYLENDPRRGGTRGKAYGVNGEYYFGGKGTLGGSYHHRRRQDSGTG
jgi:hypothetical protein